MAITPYLAMTAAEYENTPILPPKVAWMACHFSAYATGLSNIPTELPKDALIIVNDITPIHKHRVETVANQLQYCLESDIGSAVLLDFQRVPNDDTLNLTQHLLEILPCSVAVSAPLAKTFSCPVFLPPCPPYIPLKEYIQPWNNREIWLEIAKDIWSITLTEDGATYMQEQTQPMNTGCFEEAQLHSHYCIDTASHTAKFTLWRTQKDLEDLLANAEELGITMAVGLFQELGQSL